MVSEPIHSDEGDRVVRRHLPGIDLNDRNAEAATQAGSAAYDSARLWVVVTLTGATMICLLAGAWLVTGVSRPISMMTGVMRQLAQHDTAVEIFGRDRGDEIGAMAEAVQVFKENLLRGDELTTQQTTDQATKEYNAQRKSTPEAVAAIKGIMTVIQEMGAIATTIAAAVEQQGAATAGITRTTQHTAGTTGAVSVSVTAVTQAAKNTGAAATQVLTEADGLSRQAEVLRAEVDTFMTAVRAA